MFQSSRPPSDLACGLVVLNLRQRSVRQFLFHQFVYPREHFVLAQLG